MQIPTVPPKTDIFARKISELPVTSHPGVSILVPFVWGESGGYWQRNRRLAINLFKKAIFVRRSDRGKRTVFRNTAYICIIFWIKVQFLHSCLEIALKKSKLEPSKIKKQVQCSCPFSLRPFLNWIWLQFVETPNCVAAYRIMATYKLLTKRL